MAESKNFSAEAGSAKVVGTVSSSDIAEPVAPPMGLRAIGPRITFHFVGEWDAETSYVLYDVVRVNGTSYIGNKINIAKGVNPETDNEVHWVKWNDPNAQVELLQQTVNGFDARITEAETDAVAAAADATAAKKASADNATAISAEVTRAQAAEAANTAAINAEAARAEAAENVNAAAISQIKHYSGDTFYTLEDYQEHEADFKNGYGWIKRENPDHTFTPLKIYLPYNADMGGIIADNTGFNTFDNGLKWGHQKNGAWNWNGATIVNQQNMWGQLFAVDRNKEIGDVTVTVKPYGAAIITNGGYEIPQTAIYKPFHFSESYYNYYTGGDERATTYDGTKESFDFGKVVYNFNGDNLRTKVLHFWCDSVPTPSNAVVVYKVGVMCNKSNVVAFNLGMDCKNSGIQEICGTRSKIIGKQETIMYICSDPSFAFANPNFDIASSVGTTIRKYALKPNEKASVNCRYQTPSKITVYPSPDMSNCWEALIIGSKVVYTTDSMPSSIGTITAANGIGTFTAKSHCVVITETTELHTTHNEALLGVS